MATVVANADVAPRGWRLRLPERLPDLKGKWLTVYSIVWKFALIVAIAAPIRGEIEDYRRLQRPSTRPCGLILEENHGTTNVLGVFGPTADRGMVHVGSKLIAIDGRATDGMPIWDVLDHLPRVDGGTARLFLEDPSGLQHEASVTCSEAISDSFYRSAYVTRGVYFVASLLALGLMPLFLIPAAILLFVRRRREAIPALLSLSFLGLSLAMLAGFDGLLAWRIPDLLHSAIGAFGWSGLFIALASFPDGRFQPRWTLLLFLNFPLFVMSDLQWAPSWTANVTALIAMIMVVASLIVRSRRLEGVARQQLRWAFLGFSVSITMLFLLLPIFIFDSQLTAWEPRWLIWKWLTVAPLASLTIALMPMGLMVSILRYRLYDADTVIGRSAAYGVLTLGFVALFAGTEKLAEIVGERYFEHSVGIAAGAVGAAVAAACIVPLHNRVHRWAERRFQKPLIRLREGLPECLADLRDTTSVAQIADAVIKRVVAGVRSTREVVLLANGPKLAIARKKDVSAKAVEEWRKNWRPKSGDEPLDCNRKDALFPLRLRLCIETAEEPETIGWLLLGPRPDGSFFGKDEREALAHVAGPIARAIHIAQLRERREQSAEARISGLERALNALMTRLDGGRSATAS